MVLVRHASRFTAVGIRGIMSEASGEGLVEDRGGMTEHAERASVAPRERGVERSPRDQRREWPLVSMFAASVIAGYAVFAGSIYLAITALL
jgi:hypothetical protein